MVKSYYFNRWICGAFAILSLWVSYLGASTLINGPVRDPESNRASADMARFIGQSEIATYSFLVFFMVVFFAFGMTYLYILVFRDKSIEIMPNRIITFGIPVKDIDISDIENYEVFHCGWWIFDFKVIYFNLKSRKSVWRRPSVVPFLCGVTAKSIVSDLEAIAGIKNKTS